MPHVETLRDIWARVLQYDLLARARGVGPVFGLPGRGRVGEGMNLGEDGPGEGGGVEHEVEEGFVVLDGGDEVIGLELKMGGKRLVGISKRGMS